MWSVLSACSLFQILKVCDISITRYEPVNVAPCTVLQHRTLRCQRCADKSRLMAPRAEYERRAVLFVLGWPS